MKLNIKYSKQDIKESNQDKIHLIKEDTETAF